MKRIILTIITLSFLLIACNSKMTPGETIEAFYMTANDGKYEKAETYLSKDVLSHYETFGLSIKEGMNKITRNGTIKEIKIINEETKEERGSVDFKITYNDGTVEDAAVSLFKENGEWKVGFRSM